MAERARIFFVENERHISWRWKQKFKKKGIHVVGRTDNAQQAMLAIRESNPDIVISDVILNGKKDGIEFCQDLQNETDIPIILLSALVGERFMERVRPLNLAEVILKPIGPVQILDIIEGLIDNPAHKVNLDKFLFEDK